MIAPTNGRVSIGIRELWHYRELVYFLIWRDIKVRYKQTALGVMWALIQPVSTVLIFSLFWGRALIDQSKSIPYPIFVLCGLVPWQLFSHALSECSSSLVEDEKLIKKVFFPKLIIPVSKVAAGLLEFVISLLLLVPMMAYYRVVPGLVVIMLPLVALLLVLAALGVGLWFSALNVLYRDVRYVLPFVAQILFFATPIAYSSTVLPPRWQIAYGLNPMVGIVEGFRWVLLPHVPCPGQLLLLSTLAVFVVLSSGIHFFRRMEDKFADVL
jgi:lipopolysaccharide transport system permease protein